jgi:hypothetical protein
MLRHIGPSGGNKRGRQQFGALRFFRPRNVFLGSQRRVTHPSCLTVGAGVRRSGHAHVLPFSVRLRARQRAQPPTTPCVARWTACARQLPRGKGRRSHLCSCRRVTTEIPWARAVSDMADRRLLDTCPIGGHSDRERHARSGTGRMRWPARHTTGGSYRTSGCQRWIDASFRLGGAPAMQRWPAHAARVDGAIWTACRHRDIPHDLRTIRSRYASP